MSPDGTHIDYGSSIIIECDDGFRLLGKVFYSNSQKWVIIAAATGVIKEYYQKFALYLSENEWNAVIFDYRGTGQSKNGATPQTSMLEWGEKDLEAVIRWVKGQNPLTIKLAGHSIAGQVFPFAPSADQISGAFFVAAQNVSIKHWSGRFKLAVALFWYLAIPAATRLFGYLPGKVVGGNSEDLPKQVGRDWAAFGKHPKGIMQDNKDRQKQYNAIKIPIKLVALKDDRLLAPVRAIKALKQDYGNARVELQVLRPTDFGVKKIGHFGFFRSRFKDTLWPIALEWLDAK